MAKKRKKTREKREPKPPTWVIFKSFNQTKEEVHFGTSMNTPKWHGNKYDLRNVPELAHWDLVDDKIIICKIYKRKRFASREEASAEARVWERIYDHWRNFWVIQTGKNTLLPPRKRKPVKPLPVPYHYYLEEDMKEDKYTINGDENEDMDENDTANDHEERVDSGLA